MIQKCLIASKLSSIINMIELLGSIVCRSFDLMASCLHDDFANHKLLSFWQLRGNLFKSAQINNVEIPNRLEHIHSLSFFLTLPSVILSNHVYKWLKRPNDGCKSVEKRSTKNKNKLNYSQVNNFSLDISPSQVIAKSNVKYVKKSRR